MRPGDPAGWIAYGEALASMGEDEAAKKAFEQAADLARGQLEANPDAVRPHYLLGVALRGQGKVGEAAASLGTSRELEPGNPMVAYQLGLARGYQQRWQEAVDLLTEAIEKNERIAYAYYYRGRAASRVDRKDILITDLETFITMAPNAPEADQARRLVEGARR